MGRPLGPGALLDPCSLFGCPLEDFLVSAFIQLPLGAVAGLFTGVWGCSGGSGGLVTLAGLFGRMTGTRWERGLGAAPGRFAGVLGGRGAERVLGPAPGLCDALYKWCIHPPCCCD